MSKVDANKISSLSKEQLQLLLKMRAQKGLAKKKQFVKMTRNAENKYPLSNAQQRFWFLEQLSEDKALYNNPVQAIIKVDEPINKKIMNRAFSELIARHEIFRTSFIAEKGVPVQKIETEVDFEMGFEDISVLSNHDQDLYINESAVREASQDIPLNKAPLMRMRLVKLSEQSYLFLYTTHHIISDGWSNGEFLKELFNIYEQLRVKGSYDLPKPELHYIDYVQWEHDWLESEECRKSIEYWKEQFPTLPENIPLPTDKKRSLKKSSTGKTIYRPIGPELTGKINEYCQHANLSPFNFFLAALNILLYRYSGQKDIVIGVPVANRNLKEFHNIYGLMLNTLPFKMEVEADLPFIEIERQIQELTYNNLKHQMVPFDKILSALKVERNLYSTPLFQVLFVFQNIPALYSGRGLGIKPLKIDLGLTKYDLNFWVEEFNGEFVITLSARTDMFSEKAINRIFSHYLNLLSEVVGDPIQRVRDIQFFTADEQSVIFKEHQSESVDENLMELFEKACQTTPNQVAVEFLDSTLTYHQLDERANQLANLLIGKNKKCAPVAILLSRGIDMIVALLAVVKSGVPYVPIDTNLPSERIRFILEDCKADYLITETGNTNSTVFSAKPIFIDQYDKYEKYDNSSPAIENSGEDIVYIVYTSGTTGVPKGVSISNKALINYVHSITKRIGFKSQKRYATVSTLAADLGNSMIFPSLINSGKLLITSKEEVKSPDLLSERFKKNRPDYLKIVPSHFRALWHNDANILPVDTLIFGGEKLNSKLVKTIKSYAPELKIVNHYGPTEATIGVTTFEVNTSLEEIPIGKALDHAYVYILDKELMLLPVGVVGEIYIGGEALSAGYLNNEALTRKKFIDDPYRPGRKLFKTGDKGMLNDSGDILFRERVDRQVKIRGNRVELKEIEVLLERIEIIRQALVLTPGESTWHQLWAVITTNREISISQIKDRLAVSLPSYMIPDKIFELNNLPVTSNGKLDINEIHKRINDKRSLEKISSPEESFNDEEKAIKAIFCKLLKVDSPGLNESFFEIGGNSLLAIELLYHINKLTNVQLPLSFLFQNTTIEQISKGLNRQTQFSSLVKLRDGDNDHVLILVHPAGGDIFCYHAFASLLNSNVTIYGLQASKKSDLEEDIKTMATQYLAEIERINIQGTLVLGGWSMGALVAYEMAVQYEKTKNKTPDVLIIDQMAYAPSEHKSVDDIDRIVLFAEKAEHMIGDSLNITRKSIENLSARERSGLFLDKFKQHGLAPEQIDLNDFHGFLEQMIHHNEISATYYPGTYGGKVIVIRSENPLMLKTGEKTYSDDRPKDLLWGQFSNKLELVSSPGNHVSMMRKPYIETLSERVELILKYEN